MRSVRAVSGRSFHYEISSFKLLNSDMSHAEKLEALRMRRYSLLDQLAVKESQIDEYGESGQISYDLLMYYRKSVDEIWTEIDTIQRELEMLDKTECQYAKLLMDERMSIDVRLLHLDKLQASTESYDEPEESAVKPPEISLTTFDGTSEEWDNFYGNFMSTIDRNEELTEVEKFRYLRAFLTGRAARCIQGLEVTESNYPIALNMLKEKFYCHRQVCIRHWQVIRNYPKITNESPEALEDLLLTVRLHLKMLENLGEPVASNVVLLDLLSSKLPSSLIRKWQRSLPDKTMPSYVHLMEFLQSRANCNGIRSNSSERKESYQNLRHRQNLSRERTPTTTSKTSVCPICHQFHDIKQCEILKSKTVKQRFELIRNASLCTNCLCKGHSSNQCSAASCRICGKRHNTYLHRERTHLITWV